MSVGICKVCGGGIVEDGVPFESGWYCEKCGIAYSRITKETATKEGQFLIGR